MCAALRGQREGAGERAWPLGSTVSRAREPDGLPARVLAVRQRLSLSQRAFAARVGVSRNAVLRYEAGTGAPGPTGSSGSPKLGGVSVDWLLRGDRRPPEGPREWDDAVRLLRVAWREPSRRKLVRRVLRALAR
jgi:DNA-binding XRE family transcriptional regulator